MYIYILQRGRTRISHVFCYMYMLYILLSGLLHTFERLQFSEKEETHAFPF